MTAKGIAYQPTGSPLMGLNDEMIMDKDAGQRRGQRRHCLPFLYFLQQFFLHFISSTGRSHAVYGRAWGMVSKDGGMSRAAIGDTPFNIKQEYSPYSDGTIPQSTIFWYLRLGRVPYPLHGSRSGLANVTPLNVSWPTK